MSDSELIGGFFYKEPRNGAPDFVRGSISIKIEDFREWFKNHLKSNPDEEWVNIDLKISRQGKPYAAVNTWKPDGESRGSDYDDADVPF